ncbi:uncharacterized protein ACNS7B_005584 isoform 2-T2 [Menidia menidia]
MEKKEGDGDYTQRELRAETRLTGPRDSEDATRRSELIAGPLKVAQESEEDYSQTEERNAEPLASTEDNNEDASATQRQDQRAESSTVVQENCPQEKCDVHSSHGLTEEQSIISILSFALRHNTTGVLMEDLLKLLKLHSAGTTAVP